MELGPAHQRGIRLLIGSVSSSSPRLYEIGSQRVFPKVLQHLSGVPRHLSKLLVSSGAFTRLSHTGVLTVEGRFAGDDQGNWLRV